MNGTLIAETALVVVGLKPAAEACVMLSQQREKVRARKAARMASGAAETDRVPYLSETRPPVRHVPAETPPDAAGTAAPAPVPAVPDRLLRAAERTAAVAAARNAHPQWTWGQIGAETGMTGNAAKGVARRAAARALANGAAS